MNKDAQANRALAIDAARALSQALSRVLGRDVSQDIVIGLSAKGTLHRDDRQLSVTFALDDAQRLAAALNVDELRASTHEQLMTAQGFSPTAPPTTRQKIAKIKKGER